MQTARPTETEALAGVTAVLIEALRAIGRAGQPKLRRDQGDSMPATDPHLDVRTEPPLVRIGRSA